MSFTNIDENFVSKQLNQIRVKRLLELTIFLLKLASSVIWEPISYLVNRSLNECNFPESMKKAQVVPIHKKKSTLDKGNYRPVSLLPIISKVFERELCIPNLLNILVIF